MNDNPTTVRNPVTRFLSVCLVSLYQRGTLIIKKNGLKMGIFVLWWAVMGHIVIPYLLLRTDWWMFAWVTYGPLDEMILFPIAAFFLVRKP